VGLIGYVSVILLGISISLIVIVASKARRHSKKQSEINRRFFEEEEAANNVRKKEIDASLFYKASLAELPPIPEGDPNQVQRCAKRLMIRFDAPVSNLELKQQYGPAQMDIIAQYEENFNEYLKALTKWAGDIIEKSPDDALIILNKVITLGGEYRDTYKLAADIYAAKADSNGINALKKSAEKNHFKDPSVRSHILEYIHNKEKEIGAS
jgi:hypothetical protein